MRYIDNITATLWTAPRLIHELECKVTGFDFMKFECTRHYFKGFICFLQVPISSGFYSVFMRDWLKVFNKDQFLFIVTEHYSRDIPNTLIKVFEFLNLGKYCISSVAIQLSMLFKWQSTVLSTILPLFMCITKNNTCTMYINCCTCSQPKYA